MAAKKVQATLNPVLHRMDTHRAEGHEFRHDEVTEVTRSAFDKVAEFTVRGHPVIVEVAGEQEEETPDEG